MARHDDGRVVFVRYALPGEVVRARVTAERGSHWHAEAVEILEASPDRVDSLCPIAGVDGSGCCDLAFATPEAARRLKGDVVANQLERLGGHQLGGRGRGGRVDGCDGLAHPGAAGRRRRGPQAGQAGFHRYHSTESGHRPVLRAGARRHAGRPGRGEVAARRATARRARRRRSAPRRADGPAVQPQGLDPGGRGVLRGDPARRRPDVERAGHRVLAGAPRRRARPTARWSRSGPGSARA